MIEKLINDDWGVSEVVANYLKILDKEELININIDNEAKNYLVEWLEISTGSKDILLSTISFYIRKSKRKKIILDKTKKLFATI